MSTEAIPLGDAPRLKSFTRRTGVVRAALAVAILAVGLVAVLFARPSARRTTPLLAPGSDGIVVLDLSASAGGAEYAELDRYLGELATTRGRFGLVVFSDTAYEALPPDTPASVLRTLTRYFRPPYPASPWSAGFSLGTAISKGLDLARSLLLSEGVRQRQVWLISDLNDAGGDRAQLARTLHAFVSSGIGLHVLGVHARPVDVAQYRRFFGAQSSKIRVKALPAAVLPRSSYAFPTVLVVLAAVLAAALAANELLSRPLRWGRVE
ncbi:MAG TPA: vWA domain-containing protein [Gaiellaceae bacterium]|nr:vWA domain-containing protein [Gaiellaceae bacterium]